MTTNVKRLLEKIANNKIFEDELYFTGGTALAYYINHRLSEDIDIVSASTLKYKNILPAILALGANKIQDENITALRMAGLFPDEYMIKLVLDNVKVEFFQANRPIQRQILENASFEKYENTKLKILDVKTVAKLKIVALLQREKSRDLFDFDAILENSILTTEEILDIAKHTKNIESIDELKNYITNKKEPREDEAVYLSEDNKDTLPFEEIKIRVLKKLLRDKGLF